MSERSVLDPRPTGRPWRQERSFGVVVGCALIALGGLVAWRADAMIGWLLAGVGALLGTCGLVRPQALKGLRRAWLRVGEAAGVATTELVLVVIFFGVLTPLGLALRLVGYDPLRRPRRGAASYWVPYPARQQDPRHYEKMF